MFLVFYWSGGPGLPLPLQTVSQLVAPVGHPVIARIPRNQFSSLRAAQTENRNLHSNLNTILRNKKYYPIDSIFSISLERRTRFELAHPRVEALVHSLFYVTSAKARFGLCAVYQEH